MIRFRLALGAAMHLLILSGCSSLRDQNTDYQTTVGWLHGPCFAVEDPNLKPGQPLTLVTLDEPQKPWSAQIRGKATDAAECHMLSPDRRQVNESTDYSFYTVSSTIEPNLAIGLLPSAQQDLLHKATTHNLQRFSYCSSNEGIHFSLWQDKPHASERVWTGYYYLGYESEADCP